MAHPHRSSRTRLRLPLDAAPAHQARGLAAAKIGNLIKVRREDLSALVVPIEPAEPAFADVEAAVERIVASAPPLTDEQCRRLASLFGGASS